MRSICRSQSLSVDRAVLCTLFYGVTHVTTGRAGTEGRDETDWTKRVGGRTRPGGHDNKQCGRRNHWLRRRKGGIVSPPIAPDTTTAKHKHIVTCFVCLEVAVPLASICIEARRYKTAAKMLATKAADGFYTATNSSLLDGALSERKKTRGCVHHCRLLVCIQDIIVECFPSLFIAVTQSSSKLLSSRSPSWLSYACTSD